MKSFLFICINISLAINCYSQYSSPESITYDSASRRYFISNTTSQKIVQRDINGVVTDFVIVGSSIHGVTVYNNKIYVCNGTRVRGYDLSNASEIFNVTVTGSVFLNDLAFDNSGMIYVSDFNGRRIYKINSATSAYWIYVANTTNSPNGVYVDAPRNRLLVCCWGSNAPIKAVNFSDSSIANVVTTSYSNMDGISLDRNDNVYVSTWGIQSVVKYDINFSNAPVVVIGGLSNPADIYVNKITDTLAIPNAGNSTVVFHFLNNMTGVNESETDIANTFALSQNFPNPFNPTTKIEYDIKSKSRIQINVIDVLGREIKTLIDKEQSQGFYEVVFDASDLQSGIYFYRLIADGKILYTRKMVFLK